MQTHSQSPLNEGSGKPDAEDPLAIAAHLKREAMRLAKDSADADTALSLAALDAIGRSRESLPDLLASLLVGDR